MSGMNFCVNRPFIQCENEEIHCPYQIKLEAITAISFHENICFCSNLPQWAQRPCSLETWTKCLLLIWCISFCVHESSEGEWSILGPLFTFLLKLCKNFHRLCHPTLQKMVILSYQWPFFVETQMLSPCLYGLSLVQAIHNRLFWLVCCTGTLQLS